MKRAMRVAFLLFAVLAAGCVGSPDATTTSMSTSELPPHGSVPSPVVWAFQSNSTTTGHVAAEGRFFKLQETGPKVFVPGRNNTGGLARITWDATAPTDVRLDASLLDLDEGEPVVFVTGTSPLWIEWNTTLPQHDFAIMYGPAGDSGVVVRVEAQISVCIFEQMPVARADCPFYVDQA